MAKVANSVFFLAMLPLMAAVLDRTIPLTIIPGPAFEESCPSSPETVRQQIPNSVLSVLSSRYFTIDQCGAGIWYRMVHINMSDSISQCPNSWVEENVGKVRACGRGTVNRGCKSVFLTHAKHKFTKVCGRALGHQYGSTDAFFEATSIDRNPVDGLSITYGSPRQHIWTYASGMSERDVGPSSYTSSNCPCSNHPGGSPPAYVGNNWYCESGNPDPITPRPTDQYFGDTLWDGVMEDCEGTCCSSGKTPPWFSVELSAPTNTDIEARICSNENSNTNEDVFITLFEIYIQ